jgi:tRNA pseudouridine38-40 synthase
MAKAANLLKGTHDFGAFAANRGIEYESTVRKMFRSEMLQEEKFLLLNFQADGFMYKMVRSLAGTIANVGLGRLSLDAFSALLQSAERTPMVFVAPAKGLFLKKVFY